MLNLISIEYSLNDNFLYVEVDEKLYDSEAGREYVSGIEKLKEWCGIRINVASKRF